MTGDFSLLLNTKNSSGAHSASSTIGTVLSFPGGAIGSIIHLHLMLRTGMVELYLSSPIRLRNLVLNELSTDTNSP
jgi:hypothetical protein